MKTDYELHPLCSYFPRMSVEAFEELKADIKAHGQRDPVVMLGDLVLDGGHRLRACVDLGIEPKIIPFDGDDDPVAFVLSKNLRRRHLTPGQQAAIVASMADWSKAQTHGGDRRSDQVITGSLVTAADRAAMSGVGIATQRRADAVAKADPGLVRKVAAGEVTLPEALTKVGKAPVKAKPAAPVPPADAPDEDDLLKDIEELRQRNEVLEGEHAAISAEDPRHEALKWRRQYEHAKAEQSSAMERAKTASDNRDWYAKQLRRCGKAIGVDDPDKIAAAVEAFAREHRLNGKKEVAA